MRLALAEIITERYRSDTAFVQPHDRAVFGVGELFIPYFSAD